jgi:YonK protein
MAKKVHTVSLKGNFTYLDKLVEEETKTGIERYDLDQILKEFDGHNIKITISEEDVLPQAE